MSLLPGHVISAAFCSTNGVVGSATLAACTRLPCPRALGSGAAMEFGKSIGRPVPAPLFSVLMDLNGEQGGIMIALVLGRSLLRACRNKERAERRVQLVRFRGGRVRLAR